MDLNMVSQENYMFFWDLNIQENYMCGSRTSSPRSPKWLSDQTPDLKPGWRLSISGYPNAFLSGETMTTSDDNPCGFGMFWEYLIIRQTPNFGDLDRFSG